MTTRMYSLFMGLFCQTIKQIDTRLNTFIMMADLDTDALIVTNSVATGRYCSGLCSTLQLLACTASDCCGITCPKSSDSEVQPINEQS